MNYFKILNSQISWKTSFKSFIWAIGTVVFGLLQMWLLLGGSLYIKTNVFTFDEFIKNGALLFFATAVIASVTIDYLLSRKNNKYTLCEMCLFMGFPLIIIGFCVWLFAISYDVNIKNIEFGFIKYTEKNILIMTLIYSIYVKYKAFLEEE